MMQDPDIDFIYDHDRACAVHAEASREHGCVEWLVVSTKSLVSDRRLGPGMYAAIPEVDGVGQLPFLLVGLDLPTLRALLPPGLARGPGSKAVAGWSEIWFEP